MSFYSINKDIVILRVRVVPASSKNEVVGLHDDRLKIKLKAPPVDGKANEALILYLSEVLNVKKIHISLIRGQTSRSKDLEIQNTDEATVKKLLNLNA